MSSLKADDTRAQIDALLESLKSVAPFLSILDEENIQMTIYLCTPFECDFISPYPGECPRHKRILTEYVFVQPKR